MTVSVKISHYNQPSAIRLFHTLSQHETHIFAFQSRTNWIRFCKNAENEWICTQFIEGQKQKSFKFKDLESMGVGLWKYIVDSKMIQGGKDKIFKPLKSINLGRSSEQIGQ
jgi:hypothetical protein